jgi:hypothetical protein
MTAITLARGLTTLKILVILLVVVGGLFGAGKRKPCISSQRSTGVPARDRDKHGQDARAPIVFILEEFDSVSHAQRGA